MPLRDTLMSMYKGMLYPNGLPFHQTILDMGPIFVQKTTEKS